MTASRDPDRLIQAFLRAGDEELQDQVYDAVRSTIEQTRQRAGFGPWRFPIMNRFMAVGAGAVAVLAILFAGAQLFGSPGGVGGPGDPTATPEASVADPTAVPTPTPSSSPSGDAFLPDGPILLWDPQREPDFSQGGATVTVAISASGWQYSDEYQFLYKGTDDVDDAVLWPGSWAPGTGPYVYGDACRWQSTIPEAPVTTVDEIVAALAAQPNLDASQPVDVTVGEYAGKALTLRRPADANDETCDGGESGLFQSEGNPGPDLVYGRPGQINEFWFLDVEGSIVMLLGRYLPETPDESVEELRAIIESATFEPLD